VAKFSIVMMYSPWFYAQSEVSMFVARVDFFASMPVNVKDAICNAVVMSVNLSVQPRLLMSQAIISSGQVDAKLAGDRHLVIISASWSWP